MIAILLAALLAFHLLLVDVAMVGPLVCVWLEWREARRDDPLAGRAGRALAGLSIGALTAGIVVGTLLLAIRWAANDRDYFSAVATIPPSRLWFALGELVFFFACMVAYLSLWNRFGRWRLAHRALAVAASLNLLVHFPALFAIISVVCERRELWGETLDRAGYWRLLLDGEVLSRVVHVWLAAVAVTGVALMALGQRLDRNQADSPAAHHLIGRAALVALVPTLLQIPAGLWLTLEMSEAARGPLLGGDLLTSGLFLAALLLAMQLMHTLAAVALGDQTPQLIRRTVAVTLALVLLMAATHARLHNRAWAASGVPRPHIAGIP